MSHTGVLVYCFNTPVYRYDKIAAKTIPLLKKNLGLEITMITDIDTFKMLPDLGHINYKLLEPEKTNGIDRKPWYNLERHRAYDLSPYDTTILVDIDYFCYTEQLLEYAKTDHDFWIHEHVHDLTGKNNYAFKSNSIIPMLWATVIIFKKTKKVRALFDMVRQVKNNYQYYCSLYRIDFKNFRNDYAFSMAAHQIDGMVTTNKIPVKLPTLPANARVLRVTDTGITWELDNVENSIDHSDVHVIDKGVAYV